jgi:hypothetical protein
MLHIRKIIMSKPATGKLYHNHPSPKHMWQVKKIKQLLVSGGADLMSVAK